MKNRTSYAPALLAVCALLVSPVMGQGQALPTQLTPQRVAVIDQVMQRIEKDGDDFEREFKKALNSSTVKIEKRPELRVWVDRLEDTVDDLQEEYKEKDVKEAHEKLVEALEIAEGINRFMLRAEFGGASRVWEQLRADLNALAGAHTVPAIPILVITKVVAPTR